MTFTIGHSSDAMWCPHQCMLKSIFILLVPKQGLMVDPHRGTLLLITLVTSMIPIDGNPRFLPQQVVVCWMCTWGSTLRLVCLAWSLSWSITCIGMVYENLCICQLTPNTCLLRLDCTMCSKFVNCCGFDY